MIHTQLSWETTRGDFIISIILETVTNSIASICKLLQRSSQTQTSETAGAFILTLLFHSKKKKGGDVCTTSITK